MKVSKYSWMLLKSVILAVLILMAIGLAQLFVQVRAQGTVNVNIGYPFRFFVFSMNGSSFSVTYPIGVFWNFVIIFPLTFLSSLIGDYFFTQKVNK